MYIYILIQALSLYTHVRICGDTHIHLPTQPPNHPTTHPPTMHIYNTCVMYIYVYSFIYSFICVHMSVGGMYVRI